MFDSFLNLQKMRATCGHSTKVHKPVLLNYLIRRVLLLIVSHINDKVLTENNKMKKSDYFVIIAVFTIFKSSKAQEELSKCESAVER